MAKKNAMTTCTIVSVHRIEDYLGIHIKTSEMGLGSLDMVLDTHLLAKPFVAIPIGSKCELYILARTPGVFQKGKEHRLRLVDPFQEKELANHAGIIPRLKPVYLTKFSNNHRLAINEAILCRLPSIHKDVKNSSHYASAKRLADKRAKIMRLPNGNVLVIIRWGQVRSGITVKELDVGIVLRNGYQNHGKVIAIGENGFFYVLAGDQKGFDEDDAICVLSEKDRGAVSVRVKKIQTCTVEEALTILREDNKLSRELEASISKIAIQKSPYKKLQYIDHKPEYHGKVDGLRGKAILGWAIDKATTATPVEIKISVDGQELAGLFANHSASSLGLIHDVGHYAFEYKLDDSLLDGVHHQVSFQFANSGNHLENSPVGIGKGRYDGDYTINDGRTVNGWIAERCINQTLPHVEITLDDEVIYSSAKSDVERSSGRARFTCPLPVTVCDGTKHTVAVYVVDDSARRQIGRTETVHHRYQGAIEYVAFDRVMGWITNLTVPSSPVYLDLVVNGIKQKTIKADILREDKASKFGVENKKIGFDQTFPDISSEEGVCTVELYIADTDCLVSRKKTILTPKDIIVRSLIAAAEYLRGSGNYKNTGGFRELSAGVEVRQHATEWACNNILSSTINALRSSRDLPKSITIPIKSSIKKMGSVRSDIVDIIVPVYKGYDETIDCIQSVLSAQNQVSVELIVINDHSPDGRLTHKLAEMAQNNAFQLVENEENSGYVYSVNRGMTLHTDRDVVLLNSDTVVADHWLDRLCTQARNSNNVGTVTPFSNKATICSFPTICKDNEIPEGLSLQKLDGLFASMNKGEAVNIPTGVGFCMYINREVLNDVGYFDTKTWGKGYGEENDFCLRASARGWRHVLACDVFVQHHGSVSFGETKTKRIEKHLEILDRLYPDYQNTVKRFIHQDPVAKQRNRVSKILLKKNSDNYMLFVMHPFGGGAKVHADSLAQSLTEQGEEILELRALPGNRWELHSKALPYTLHYRYPRDYTQFVEDLKELGVWRIHYHHTLLFPREIKSLPKVLNVAYDYTAHDYLPICPRINMIDESGGYCGKSQFSAEKCNRCIEVNGFDVGFGLQDMYSEYKNSIFEWRAAYEAFLSKADNIFAPSKDTASRFQKHFDIENIVTKPHPEAGFEIVTRDQNSNTEIDVYNVAVIGAIGLHKGYEFLYACAKNALKEGTPLRFIVIGHTCDDERLEKFDNVTITGEYELVDQAKLLSDQNCSVAVFFSPWPETYCYTLTEALRNGLHPIAFDIGAVSERIKALGFGTVIPFTKDANTINETIMTTIEKLEKTKISYPGASYVSLLEDYYELCDEEEIMDGDLGLERHDIEVA